jgi:hypothetical protein
LYVALKNMLRDERKARECMVTLARIRT